MELFIDLQHGGNERPINAVFIAEGSEEEALIQTLQNLPGELRIYIDEETVGALTSRYAEGQLRQVDFVER